MRFHTAINKKDTKRAHLRAGPCPTVDYQHIMNSIVVWEGFSGFFLGGGGCPIILYLNMFLTLQVYCIYVTTSSFVLLGLSVFANLCLSVSICVSFFFFVFFSPISFVLSALFGFILAYCIYF